MAEVTNVIETTTNLNVKLCSIYSRLKSEILQDSVFNFVDNDHQWINRMLDCNIPGGKLNRGLSVVDCFKLLKGGKELEDDELLLACSLDLCIEWLQSYFQVLFDIMDGYHTRRGQPCWFKDSNVGLKAANDRFILRIHIPRILRRHFKGKLYYIDLLDLFNEIEFQTVSGQMLDLITTQEGEKDLSKYKLPIYRRIVQFKTGYYSFYLPVACALLMSGENLDNFTSVRNILVEMGTYLQVEDDYLDCFGDPEVIGKIGKDIEDFKCSWMIVQALEQANEDQTKILYENYGKSNDACVAKVKTVYKDLNLQDIFSQYKKASNDQLISQIKSQPSKVVQELLKSLFAKIYKTQVINLDP
ncbi:Farnesyl pyrophosphate synthase 2 [Zostera marina]|uniref:Farnesyl pyrophosphate synthase 2 n=1 Tax=Zostera marina TaxID=29655 RepID=A0A0K9NSK0_ZOSMR|nr:Farnesyl pyrophosphate synthase 2 [Zostera marina]